MDNEEIVLKLYRKKVCCLIEVMGKQFLRKIHFIAELEKKDRVNQELLSNTQLDAASLGSMLIPFRRYRNGSAKTMQKIALDRRDTLVIMKAFDDEFELYQKGESELAKKYLKILEPLRDEIKRTAINQMSGMGGMDGMF
ncbi:MAG: hypothetical protein ABSA17_06860 [Rhabdochlamydiaceae bacterium]